MQFFLPSNEKGFTLIELTLAACILAFGILGYTLLKSSNKYGREYSKETSQSIQLVRSQLEEFMFTNYNSSLLTSGTHTAVTMPKIGDFQLSNAQWRVRDGCPSEFTKTIDFTATWGGSKRLTLTHVMVQP